MHDERLKIKHENGRSNLDEMWHSMHVQEKKKMEGAWSFLSGLHNLVLFRSIVFVATRQVLFPQFEEQGGMGNGKAQTILKKQKGRRGDQAITRHD